MIVSVAMMKKVNAGVMSGNYLTLDDVARGCSLDPSAMSSAAGGELDRPIKSMGEFFEALDAYIAEISKRLKMMSECYTAIQKLQIEHEMITKTDENPDPPIIWRG